MYKNGETNNELKNIKEQQLVIKDDLTNDLKAIEERKAEKDVVELIFAKMNSIESKLDTLIMDKV